MLGGESAHAAHVVQICGWGTQRVDGKQVDYWIVENSWGAIYKSFDSVHNEGFLLIARRHPVIFATPDW
jgi:hypothetical protein